jgi:adenosine deaminase
MLKKGLMATINSDDPAYFGGYINDNFQQLAESVDLSDAEIVTLVENSFKASFLPESIKQIHLKALNLIG